MQVAEIVTDVAARLLLFIVIVAKLECKRDCCADPNGFSINYQRLKFPFLGCVNRRLAQDICSAQNLCALHVPFSVTRTLKTTLP